MGTVEMDVDGAQANSVLDLRLRRATSEAEASLTTLGSSEPAVTVVLSRLVKLVADEAARTPRFAKALTEALSGVESVPTRATPTPATPHKSAKRSKGVFDPFAVFEVSGEQGLRARLRTLEVEQLKDIIAEHSMNYDRAAMRWKSLPRLIDRIVERVHTRSTKGDVLR